jgi:hypothetical protein
VPEAPVAVTLVALSHPSRTLSARSAPMTLHSSGVYVGALTFASDMDIRVPACSDGSQIKTRIGLENTLLVERVVPTYVRHTFDISL